MGGFQGLLETCFFVKSFVWGTNALRDVYVWQICIQHIMHGILNTQTLHILPSTSNFGKSMFTIFVAGVSLETVTGPKSKLFCHFLALISHEFIDFPPQNGGFKDFWWFCWFFYPWGRWFLVVDDFLDGWRKLLKLRTKLLNFPSFFFQASWGLHHLYTPEHIKTDTTNEM